MKRLFGNKFNKDRNKRICDLSKKYRSRFSSLCRDLLNENYDHADLRQFLMSEMNLTILMEAMSMQVGKRTK